MSQILGYARVSTDDQDLAGQRLRLDAIGAFRVFEDTVSGRRMDRPGLQSLLEYARPGDTLAVVRLDRLGRSMRELLELVEDLKRRGLALQSLEERIDTSSAAGELILHVFAAMAQFERRLISDRTKDGLAARRAQGVRLGRAPIPVERLTAAVALLKDGMTVRRAAEAIGVGRSSLYRELHRLEATAASSEDGGQTPPKSLASRPTPSVRARARNTGAASAT